MSTAWRRWPSNDPKALIEYVQRKRQGESGAPAAILAGALPPVGDTPPTVRACALYEAFAARNIVYADEPTTSDSGRQTIRPPYEVLASPGHGTCLDIAVTFAGACLDAGLHPLVLVTGGGHGGPGHALVAVWLEGNWSNHAHREYRSHDETDADWQTLPEDFLVQLADAEDGSGAFLAIDVTGVASSADAADPRRRSRQSWAESVAHGAELVRQAADDDRLEVTLDVGLGYEHCEPLPLPDQPRTQILTPPYLDINDSKVGTDSDDTGPLKLLWARYDTIHFHPRDELDFLQDWFRAPDPDGPRTRIALVHGVGGAGKTRLAAELAARMADTGWFTGFLVRDPDLQDCAWLARTASPLLVVVDYADDHKSADIIALLRVLRGRQEPTCLLLTARSVRGWWEEEIVDALKDSSPRPLVHSMPLSPRHPRQTGVYRAALRSFGAREATAMGSSPPPDPHSGRWTTLDLVMLAWLDAQTSESEDKAPVSESALYERILKHELLYWVRVYRSRIGEPSNRAKEMLREAGACVSLLAPREDRLNEVLATVKELATDAKWRDEFTALLEKLLPTTPEDGTVAVRPDPVGTHLAATVFRGNDALFGRCLETADTDERLNACVGVSRLATAINGKEAAQAMAGTALERVPELWPMALSVAASQGGPFVTALERFAETEDTPLPLAELSVTLPTGHSTLRGLALIATVRSRPDQPADPSEESRAAIASWHNNLAIRQSETGDQQGALTSITQAVIQYRALVQGPNGPDFLPNLAMALNNLSNRQSETGDQRASLTSITEAVTHYRALVEGPNGPDFLPDLAGFLNNLSVQQGETGDHQAALTSVTEAVTHYRALVEGPNGPDFLPDLAMALNNLASRQSETGDHQAALTSITEAVTIRHALAQGPSGPAFLPDLAGSLNNLANQQSNTGNHQAALTSITQAVNHYRALAEGPNGPAFAPNLAMALNNLSNQQSSTGNHQAALTSITEAVNHYR
ncbi:hypothetical protein ACWEWO_01765, partial [Streptomyces humi]